MRSGRSQLFDTGRFASNAKCLSCVVTKIYMLSCEKFAFTYMKYFILVRYKTFITSFIHKCIKELELFLYMPRY